MKRAVSLVSAFVLFFSSVQFFCVNAVNIPLNCVVSDVENGKFSVTVYANNVKKLTNAVINVKYDTGVFLSDGVIESDFDSYSWEHGELADKSGYAAAFISASGVSKSSLSVLCRFFFSVKNGYSDNTSVKVVLKEFVTDDGKENDIFCDETVAENKIILSDKERFSCTGNDFEKVINGYNFNEEFVFVPSFIEGKIVSGITEGAFDGCGETVFVFANGAQKIHSNDGYKYILFSEDCTVNHITGIVRSKENLCGLSENIVKTNCKNEVIPSYSYNNGAVVFFGTGSVFAFENGENKKTYNLSVKGDIDGDSVCDVCDLFELERASNGQKTLTDVQFYTADVNSDGKITERDKKLFFVSGGEKITDGDFDGDGVFDAIDITYYEKALNNPGILTGSKFAVADLNCDGAYDEKDYLLLVNMMLEAI